MAIDNLRGADKGALTRFELKKSFDAAKEKQMAYVGVYLLDVLKVAVLEQADMLKGVMPNLNISQIVKQVPNSKFPMVLTMGTDKDSMNMEVHIPSLSISEAVIAIQQAVMQVMMQQGQGGGGAKPGGPPIF